MNGNEISELASMLPSPASRDLPDDRANVLREHMMTEFRRAPERNTAVPARIRRRLARRPSRMALAGACVVAVAAAAGGFAIVSATSSPGGATPAAARLLARIATAAEQQSSPQVRDSEFMYIRSEVAFASYTNGSPTPTMDKLHERQVWLPVANVCVTGLLIEEGESTLLSPYTVINGKIVHPSPGEPAVRCGEGTVNGPTYRLLQSLPTDPRALLNLIYADTQGEGQAVGPDGEAFTTIGDLIREAIVPPRTAAALYRAAALIPGVTLVGHVTNAVGRPGIAIAWTNSQGRSEWIFDRATLQFIGERDYDNNAHQVTGDTAILQQAFVAKPGQFPKR
ncbi:hypothetical protein EAS64_30430 [Trebonia kvetii]|uniref:Uncharacterized protein n=1 Tax=Trebonia kvetii TaxID=2480626 RepID=A0A6P2BRY4_9ACTN|nr:CU044_5270 family protein [Trebonia kvetii]TVZ01774.1 hypothetical protein EAS64_30430 [Trebonia kvetii]